MLSADIYSLKIRSNLLWSIKEIIIKIFFSRCATMEVKYNKVEFKFKNLILALIFMGIIMLVISYYLPSETNGNIKETLRILGIFFILIGFFVIILPYIMKEILKTNR